LDVVAGLSIKNPKPRVWDPSSPYYLPALTAVMVSYADFHAMHTQREKAMGLGLRTYLGLPSHVRVYLDNGAFYFRGRPGCRPHAAYKEFVTRAKPDWYPIPHDFIPIPSMGAARQRHCYERTMELNRAYQYDGFVPVVHANSLLPQYVKAIARHATLSAKSRLALGGMVPNLLRKPKAVPYADVLTALRHVRAEFPNKQLHVFGMGGTATLHIAALLGFDSLDSSGWRNRAARGIVQLPGSGDRTVANFGSWRGREPDERELRLLKKCVCPACRQGGFGGMIARGLDGFCHRATHNLWVLLGEADWIGSRLAAGSYAETYTRRLDNTIYAPLVSEIVRQRFGRRYG
jgi:7-cyano-7-deazaguanine tRNA-ribosyltransferase